MMSATLASVSNVPRLVSSLPWVLTSSQQRCLKVELSSPSASHRSGCLENLVSNDAVSSKLNVRLADNLLITKTGACISAVWFVVTGQLFANTWLRSFPDKDQLSSKILYFVLGLDSRGQGCLGVAYELLLRAPRSEPQKKKVQSSKCAGPLPAGAVCSWIISISVSRLNYQVWPAATTSTESPLACHSQE